MQIGDKVQITNFYVSRSGHAGVITQIRATSEGDVITIKFQDGSTQACFAEDCEVIENE